ncbi:hypothetical protein Tco_1077230 [Tanacetum coccineum]
MIGPTPNPTTPDQSPSLQDQILNHISSFETIIKQHNEKARALITPIRLTFDEEGDNSKGKDKEKGSAEETRTTISPALLERLTKGSRRCRYGVGCSNKRWMGWRGVGLTECLTVALIVGQTSVRSLWKDLPCEEDAAKI